jgi:Flp pilus assembly protein TadG
MNAALDQERLQFYGAFQSSVREALVMRQRLFDVVRDHTGSVLVEFTLVLPVLLFLILGLAQFGMIFYNYILVTNAAATGARQFSISRLDSTPYTDTQSAINSATTNLSGLTISMSVNGTACSSDSACQSALQTAYTAATIPPEPVSVTVSYSCSSNSIMPAYLVNLVGVCPLTATMQQPVE